MMMVIIQHFPGDSHIVVKSENAWDMPYAVQNIPLQDEQDTRTHIDNICFFNIHNTLFWDIIHIINFTVLEYKNK